MKKYIACVLSLSLLFLSSCGVFTFTDPEPPESSPPPSVTSNAESPPVSQEDEATLYPSPDPTPVYAADADSIRQLAADKFSFDYEDLDVAWDDFDEAFVVSFYPTALPLDESTWVYESLNRYIKFCQFAYSIDGLDRVRFDITAHGTDQYGNDVSFLGLSVLMARDDFSLFNWDNLAYTEIWDVFVDSCYVFSLADSFSSLLDTSKVFYDPFLRNGLIP